jgi:glucokinase
MSTVRAAIGVDVGGTKTKAAIVDGEGQILLRVERPTDPIAGTKGILAVTEDLIRRAEEIGADVTGIGVGAAGFIHAPTGSVIFAPNLTYDDPEIAQAVYTRMGLPIIVDNDANAAAWGERAFGAAQGCDHVVLLTIGTGIGGGIISDGKLVRGATGAGAELGHVVMDPAGPACKCGLRGCFEQFASGQAIARMGRAAAEADPESTIRAFAGSVEAITAEHVAKAARELDETARSVMHRAGTYLGIGLSNFTNVFDPEVIVLGGSVIAAAEPFLGPARDQLVSMTASQRRRPMRLDVTKLGRDAGILGAAALAFDEARVPSSKRASQGPG